MNEINEISLIHPDPRLDRVSACVSASLAGQDWMNAELLEAALKSGAVKEAQVDDSVRRILTQLYAIGNMEVIRGNGL